MTARCERSFVVFVIVLIVGVPVLVLWDLLTAGFMDSGETDRALVRLRIEAWGPPEAWVFPVISDGGETWTWPRERGT